MSPTSLAVHLLGQLNLRSTTRCKYKSNSQVSGKLETDNDRLMILNYRYGDRSRP